MSAPLFLPVMAVTTCLGAGKAVNAAKLFSGDGSGLIARAGLFPGRTVTVGAIAGDLPPPPAGLEDLDSRNNRLLMVLADEIRPALEDALGRFGSARMGIVLGTSTSGIAEGETAVDHLRRHGGWPGSFRYEQQEAGSGAAFLARLLGISGPAYVIATACSSSAKAFAAARRLMSADVIDGAIVGGADTLCRLTIAGFSALEAVSPGPCNPFSANRNGITIGEGGALFLMTREPAEIALLGVGETADAHHISAPDPGGTGARLAMAQAIADAGLGAADIAYLNLHGTATALNDAMESRSVHELFGGGVPCSSTKALTGHTLGAAGAIEAALLWLTLSSIWNPDRYLPPQLWDGLADRALPALNLVAPGTRLPSRERLAALSNSFAFGGSNCSLVLGRGWGKDIGSSRT